MTYGLCPCGDATTQVRFATEDTENTEGAECEVEESVAGFERNCSSRSASLDSLILAL